MEKTPAPGTVAVNGKITICGCPGGTLATGPISAGCSKPVWKCPTTERHSSVPFGNATRVFSAKIVISPLYFVSNRQATPSLRAWSTTAHLPKSTRVTLAERSTDAFL